jgi:formylglycine-generating enzyme required for sulfatase activity
LEGGADLQRTSAVGLYPQGATPEGGLLDMAGNVWEWCAVAYDPKDAKRGEFAKVGRVLRGGSWSVYPAFLRAAFRFHVLADDWFNYFGFRVCRASPIEKLGAGAAER